MNIHNNCDGRFQSIYLAINFGYSNKNIPIAPHNMYLRRLVEKTEQFLRKMRWKAFFCSNSSATADSKETYGFKSRNSPPAIQELREFELPNKQTKTYHHSCVYLALCNCRLSTVEQCINHIIQKILSIKVEFV